jgi:hypothetical protein
MPHEQSSAAAQAVQAIKEARQAKPEADPEIEFELERYVKWRNDTGRLVKIEVDGKPVNGWFPTRCFSLPDSASEQALEAGLTCLGYTQS